MKINVISPGIFLPSHYGNLAISAITLIEYEDYKLLVDLGGYGQRSFLINRLEDINISTQDISHVFVTHLHWDHIANFDLFSNAIFMISENELQSIEDCTKRRDVATPHQILNVLESINNVQSIKGNEEIFPYTRGILTAGHTKGHMSLMVEKENEKYCVAGDAVTNLESIKNGSPSLAFYNLVEAQNSIKKITNMADIIIPGHDSTLIKTSEEKWSYFYKGI